MLPTPTRHEDFPVAAQPRVRRQGHCVMRRGWHRIHLQGWVEVRDSQLKCPRFRFCHWFDAKDQRGLFSGSVSDCWSVSGSLFGCLGLVLRCHVWLFTLNIQSDSQTWQWNIPHFMDDLPIKTSFIGDFPANHVWWHRRVNIRCVFHYITIISYLIISYHIICHIMSCIYIYNHMSYNLVYHIIYHISFIICHLSFFNFSYILYIYIYHIPTILVQYVLIMNIFFRASKRWLTKHFFRDPVRGRTCRTLVSCQKWVWRSLDWNTVSSMLLQWDIHMI